jgi:16S rRNA (uracil1498-N3)-methyltransferase
MPPRFFAPTLDADRREAVLPAEESAHLSRVLRLRAGAKVEVFDGRGREFIAEVADVARDRVTLTLLEARAPAAEPRVPVMLAQAILKPQQMDDVVRDATMMGASAVVPIVSAHVTVPGRAIEGARPVERWRRIALASVKQCRRSTIPRIDPPVTFADWLGAVARRSAGPTLLLVEPSVHGVEPRTVRSLIHDPIPESATLAVGPEGGWSAEEVSGAVRAGATPITLGPLTLRAETVAVAALAALSVIWGE